MPNIVNNCRLEMEDRELLAQLRAVPKAFKTFARPESVGVEWHKDENQGPIGSCFPAGTKVTMANGELRNIEDVRFGEYVLSGSRKAQPVIDTMSREFTGTMVTAFVKGWGKVRMTDDHVVRAMRDGAECWLKAGELTTDDMMIVSHGIPEASTASVDISRYITLHRVLEDDGWLNSQSSIPTRRMLALDENACFVLGLYCAEGSTCYDSSGNPSRACWTLHEDETDLADQVGLFAESLGLKHSISTKAGSKAINVRICSSVLAEFLSVTCGRFCNHKRVPEFILRGTQDQKLAFIRGYYAGDGSDTKYHAGRVASSGNRVACRQVHAASASRTLAQQVATLSVSIGMKPGRTFTRKRNHQNHHSYQTFLYSEDAARMVGEECVPGRARKRIESASGQCRRIRAIDRQEVSGLEVYDLTVGEDHSFVAQGLVVHNCQGHSLSSGLERLDFVAKKPYVQLSRIFAYLATQKIDGLLGSDQGSTITGGAKLARDFGVCPESMTGYPPSYPSKSARAAILSPGNYTAALPYKAASLWEVPADPDEAKNWIGGGGAISLGIRWPGLPKDRIIKSYNGGSGGHAVAVLGYDLGHMIAIGSWGDGPFRITNAAWWQMMRASYTAAVGLAGASEPEPQPVRVHLDW